LFCYIHDQSWHRCCSTETLFLRQFDTSFGIYSCIDMMILFTESINLSIGSSPDYLPWD
jgi:hypothetical protein